MVEIMINPATLATAIITRLIALSTAYKTAIGNDHAEIYKIYYEGVPVPVPAMTIFGVVQHTSINPEYTFPGQINSYRFQVDIYVRILANPEQPCPLLSEVVAYLLEGLTDIDFVTAGCWFTSWSNVSNQTEFVVEAGDAITPAVSYMNQNFVLELKEDDT